jgi:ATP-binding cassette subfamily B protein
MARGIVSEEGDKKKINRDNLRKLLGIFRFVLPYKKVFSVGLIALVLSTLTVLSFPFFTGKLVDVAQGKPGFTPGYGITVDSLAGIAAILFGVLFLQAIFSFTRVYTFSVVSEKTLADLRHAVYEKIMWLPQTFFDSRRTGELISRITSDAATLQDTFTVTVAELLRQVLVLVIGTVFLLVLTPQLTLFMMLTFPVIVLSALFFGKFIRKLSKNTQDQLALTNVIVEETFQSIAVVKSFTNELFEILRYRKSINNVVRIAIRTAKYRSLFISFTIFMVFGGIFAVSWYGASLVQRHQISVGDLLTFVLYMVFIGGSVAGLGDIYSQLQRAIGASERLDEILIQQDEKSVSSGWLKLDGAIVFKNVSFSYPSRADVPVLKEVSFHLKPGEKIALVGPSGSGKSTIVNLLMRFYPLPSNSVLVDEVDILDYPLSDYRSNIGIVPQEVILFGGTIRENIAYGKPEATEDEIIAAAQLANAWDFIQKFPEKLGTRVGDRGVQLSGGQRQRVAIARAILKDPSILILDEATSALDAESERLVQDALERLMENRTTIIIAHRLSTIRKADRILVLKDGAIAESGSHRELSLVENGIYNNLLKLQTEISL